MKRKLNEEVQRIKQLSSINESFLPTDIPISIDILSGENTEKIKTLVGKLKKFFEIVGDEVKQSEVGIKLKKLLDILDNKIIDTFSSDETETETILTPVSSTRIPEKVKELSSADDDTYKKILDGLGAPWNDVNKLLMYSWRRAEGGTYRNNPFNTKFQLIQKPLPSNKPGGIQNYPTPEDGIDATLKTFKGKYKSSYDPIVDALKNSDPEAFFEALGDSPWGTNADLAKEIYDDYINGVSDRKPTKITP